MCQPCVHCTLAVYIFILISPTVHPPRPHSRPVADRHQLSRWAALIFINCNYYCHGFPSVNYLRAVAGGWVVDTGGGGGGCVLLVMPSYA